MSWFFNPFFLGKFVNFAISLNIVCALTSRMMLLWWKFLFIIYYVDNIGCQEFVGVVTFKRGVYVVWTICEYVCICKKWFGVLCS